MESRRSKIQKEKDLLLQLLKNESETPNHLKSYRSKNLKEHKQNFRIKNSKQNLFCFPIHVIFWQIIFQIKIK